jgi:transcriptional regulator with XRE-family HTH domain
VPVTANPTLRAKRLGRQLKELRLAAGLSPDDAAELLVGSAMKVRRIEGAQSGIRLVDLRILLDAYGVQDATQRIELEALARHAKTRGLRTQYDNLLDSAYADYVEEERRAKQLYNVETAIIPGLLQTSAYTEAVIRVQVPGASEKKISAQVEVKSERTKLLTKENPLQLWAIFPESVLYHQVSEPDVMRDQLDRLLELSVLENVEIQILPMGDPANVLLYGPFAVLTFPASAEPDMAYRESPEGTLYYEDSGDVEKFSHLFRKLNKAAGNTKETRALIERARREPV